MAMKDTTSAAVKPGGTTALLGHLLEVKVSKLTSLLTDSKTTVGTLVDEEVVVVVSLLVDVIILETEVEVEIVVVVVVVVAPMMVVVAKASATEQLCVNTYKHMDEQQPHTVTLSLSSHPPIPASGVVLNWSHTQLVYAAAYS